MAIESIKDSSIFRPNVIKREKDAGGHRRKQENGQPEKERKEKPDPEKGKVDIRV